MALNRFQRHWIALGKAHSLDVSAPFSLQLPDGTELCCDVLLRGYGAANGMLLMTDFSKIRACADQLIEQGYGFSCLSEPSNGRLGNSKGLAELLEDWGESLPSGG